MTNQTKSHLNLLDTVQWRDPNEYGYKADEYDAFDESEDRFLVLWISDNEIWLKAMNGGIEGAKILALVEEVMLVDGESE